MINFETEDETQNLTCKHYPYKTELRYIAYCLLMELYEVIKIFNKESESGNVMEQHLREMKGIRENDHNRKLKVMVDVDTKVSRAV